MNTAESAAKAVPATLADVALIDGATACAAGGMSISWWHEEVRAGRAPAPVVRGPRCTRWKLADVRGFWIAFAARGVADAAPGQRLKAHAAKASAAARAKGTEGATA